MLHVPKILSYFILIDMFFCAGDLDQLPYWGPSPTADLLGGGGGGGGTDSLRPPIMMGGRPLVVLIE